MPSTRQGGSTEPPQRSLDQAPPSGGAFVVPGEDLHGGTVTPRGTVGPVDSRIDPDGVLDDIERAELEAEYLALLNEGFGDVESPAEARARAALPAA